MLFNPIISKEILSPRELIDQLGLEVEDNININIISLNEFEDIFPDIWTYPLDEITHLIEEGIYVYICKFDDGITRYVEDIDHQDPEFKSLFPDDFDLYVSYEKDTNTLVINSDNSTGVRYYLNEKSDIGIRTQNYIDYILFEKGEK